jgi:hypothetical protein
MISDMLNVMFFSYKWNLGQAPQQHITTTTCKINYISQDNLTLERKGSEKKIESHREFLY